MKRVLLIVAVLVSCACERSRIRETLENAPVGTPVTDPKTGLIFTFHQKGAGTPDATGWYPATSRPCGFRVSLPGPFNDFTQQIPAVDGATIYMHLVGTRTIEGVKFTVTCTERSDGKVEPTMAQDIVDGLRKNNPELVQKSIRVEGADGLEFSMKSSRSAAIGRIFAVDKRGYQMMVEYPHSEAEYMPGVAATFFESFRLR